ncbi:alginate lyase family protein [Sutcliffiella horikoshii]|uniref:alginate lyase family protein n=1 Tax=Sutcliffiella horikoshii TaxID=79883 RepID=UPI003CF2AD08
MLKVENALLLDICLGESYGKSWLPAKLPKVHPENVPDTMLLKGDHIAGIKELVRRRNDSIMGAIDGLRKQADLLMHLNDVSVIEKSEVPQGISKNDYLSYAKYWWPNPESSNGLPYIRKDGEVNPECYSENSDLNRLETFSNSTFLLALTAYFTGERTYASKARNLVKVWIMDPVTRQNPNFEYAQLIKGANNQRYAGLVESRRLIYVCEAIKILEHLNYLTSEEVSICKKWYSDLLDWFLTSKQGINARKSKNNIGFWTDLQKVVFAHFCDRQEIANETLSNCVLPRMEEQIDPSGKMDKELERSKPYDYVAFTLLALAELYSVSEKTELSLEAFSENEGSNFQNAHDWFMKTTKSNKLNERNIALAQLSSLSQRYYSLKQENEILKVRHDTQTSFKGEMENTVGESSEIDRLRVLEVENSKLNTELWENNQLQMNMTLFYRGIDYIVQEQREILTKKEKKNKELEKEIQQLTNSNKKKNDELEKEIQRLTNSIKKKNNELEKINKNEKKLSKELKLFKNEVKKLKRSRSWRLMGPFRRASRFVKATIKNKKKKDSQGLKVSNPSINAKTKENKRVLKKLAQLRYKLCNLGFVEKAYEDLNFLLLNTDNKAMRRETAWELSVWHANQYTHQDANKSLEYLKIVENGEIDLERLRKIAIIKAENLEILGRIEEAKKAIKIALQSGTHPDLYLAFANLETNQDKRLDWINKSLNTVGISTIEIDGTSTASKSYYDQLNVKQRLPIIQHPFKVTVIIPVYNAEDVIQTSVRSILEQTWENLEVIIVDDCSTDNTVQVINEFVARDKRVKLIQPGQNGGAYVARNHALQVASGDFVTINDADDWSHPEKIATQVSFLLDNPNVMGCTSQQARTTNDLKFFRRGKPGEYIFSNMSSFMFRRKPVTEAIGFWDCVRFGADSEFIKRMKKVFGSDCIVEMPTGPLSFQRQSDGSLTGNSAFGFPGYFMGARKEYFEAQNYYHSIAENLYYDFPQIERPFPIPEPMWPQREEKVDGKRHFDVIIVSDFRLDGGSNMSNLEEIKAHKKLGLRTGLVQMSRYDYTPKKKINTKIRNEMDGDKVQMIVFGEYVSCDLLILRYPPILQEKQRFIPNIKAQEVIVVINQPPMSDYGEDAKVRYQLSRSERHLQEYFGEKATWYPIGPLVRNALHDHHNEDLKYVNLSKENWSNIIDVQWWMRKSYEPNRSVIKIGRHSRGQAVKWPSTSEDLLNIYPEDNNFEICILGGAEAPTNVLGYLPKNWSVIEFGQVHPREFLADIDVFVYFTHPDWVESFGRVIIEAMAVGVPVIIPHSYKSLFGKAAIYAEPHEVKMKVKELMDNPTYYHTQVNIAHEYIEEYFGYSMHASRIMKHSHPRIIQNDKNKELVMS